MEFVPKFVDIAQVIQDAHDSDLWRNPVINHSLAESVSALLAYLQLEKVDFVVVGGIAMLAYVEGRNTKDLDIILALTELERLRELSITNRDSNFAAAKFNDLQVDVLLTQNQLFALVQQQYTAESAYQSFPIRVATPKGLVLLKLFALPSLYRQGNFDRVALYETDVTVLWQRYPMERAGLLETLKPFLSETDLGSLDEILDDIDKRIRRFRERPISYDTN